jgi:tetratricopeptide (TPR) repeat protein
MFDRAVRAIQEAQDFVPNADDESILMPLAEIARSHECGILSDEECTTLTPMKAMQRYYTYASQQLAGACEDIPVASELLHALGKLHTVMARSDTGQPSVDRAIAMVMHQAALAVDTQNFKSANELGVAYANLGYPQAAKQALLRSLAAQPSVDAWDNLAAVHRQLGEETQARHALAEKAKLVAELGSEADSPIAQQIRWVSQDEFASPPSETLQYTAGSEAVQQTPQATASSDEQPTANKKTLLDHFRNAFRPR